MQLLIVIGTPCSGPNAAARKYRVFMRHELARVRHPHRYEQNALSFGRIASMRFQMRG